MTDQRRWTASDFELLKVKLLENVMEGPSAGRSVEYCAEVLGAEPATLTTAAFALANEGLLVVQAGRDGSRFARITGPGEGVVRKRLERRSNRRLRVTACREALLNWCYSNYAENRIRRLDEFSQDVRAHFEGDRFTNTEVEEASRDLAKKEMISGFVAVGGAVFQPTITNLGITVVEQYGGMPSRYERQQQQQRPRSTRRVVEAVAQEGPIFVVHGRDHGTLHYVVRVLQSCTGRNVVVLHEQPSAGRTILEKFEQHAAAAAYAVVLLTGDDEGGLVGGGTTQPRARQNVIFELGFFFGKLGRKRVAVLRDDGVEKPSDIDGLIYFDLDTGGGWKHLLAKEVQAAGIAVDFGRIP